MRRLSLIAAFLPACVSVSIAADEKSNNFASRVRTLTDLILERHIDPPTRQQLLLEGTRAVYRTVDQSLPQDTSRRISKLTTDAEVDRFLAELHGKFDKKQQTPETFINAMLQSLPGGAHYISGEELRVQGQLNANRYVGTGIVLRSDNKTKRPAIPKVFYDGPAWKAGVKAGDLILAIDGKSTEKMSLRDVVRLLRGEKGSVVEVQVRQPASQDARTLKITRNVAFIPTVEGYGQPAAGKWEYRIDSAPHLAYVRINRIGSSTLHELRQVEAKLRGKGVRAIVLDLRFGGGILHDIVMVADSLLDGGAIGRVRSGDDAKQHTATGGALFAKLPIAVLVDRRTNSGREFLAAALQDNRRAIVVGEPTGGDGFVRSYVKLPGGESAVVMATGELQRGDGTPLRAFGSTRRMHIPVAVTKPAERKNRPGGIVPDRVTTISDARRAKLMQAYSYTTPGLRKPVADPLVEKAVEALNASLSRVGSKARRSGKQDG